MNPKKNKISAKESLFVKNLKLVKANPNKFGLIMLFDALFLVSFFYIMPTLTGYFAQSLVLPQNYLAFSILIIFQLIYYLAALLIYSFFKYNVLEVMKSLFEKTSISFDRFWKFYLLNVVIAGIFFAVILALSFVLAGINQQYTPFVFIFMAAPYLLFLYATVNISHSFFYQNSSIKDSLKKGFGIAFTKIKIYKETILIIVLASLALWLLFFGSGYLIMLLGSKNYMLYLKTYAYFSKISVIVFDLFFYLIILINRISFYSITKD